MHPLRLQPHHRPAGAQRARARGTHRADPGRGTFVLKPRIERDFADTLSFTEEMQRRGLDPETRLVAARPEPAGEVVAGALDLEVGSPTSTWSGCGSPRASRCCSNRSTCRPSGFPASWPRDLEHDSLYDLLTERYGTHIARAREALEPVLLRTREARLLDQPPRTPALVIEGVAFDEDGDPIEFGRTFVRGDRTRYYVERIVVRSNRPSDHEPALVAGLRTGGPAGS